MLPEAIQPITAKSIKNALFRSPEELLLEFYEMQNQFLYSRYKINNSMETSNILTFLGRSLHLSIVRERESHLNYDVSLNNFFFNINKNASNSGHKIASIVSTTGIPKETVRRKIKKLQERKVVDLNKKTKEYFWILKPQNKEIFIDFIENDIKAIAKFILAVTKLLGLNLKIKFIEEEIKTQFSFYYYHYYGCQLQWFKMWQTKIKDVDLIFIAIQALIPALKYKKTKYTSKADENNIYSIIGKSYVSSNSKKYAISASSISEISGIPRATCLRKIEKLIQLGMLRKENDTKRYYINQSLGDRTRHITKKENIDYTIQIFSEFLSIIISALLIKK